ncbi:hypothetical protein H1W37_18960 [Stappia taiwanensis]|uniref:Alanine dehydrogenase/pyridine nucleotide transhydrogenase N-terminal domain-containing protein n=1 Tax=Stappia taiwanensis TaxID=992267 RepID=A0A838Y3J2_9HYPH|nr:hypothetical protein [Stappia taiwanensis]MBA4613744.1 hypothetical protein [Stappia taiwanensis]GGE93711.1 hypothetical protein GCM10007285_21710 [Stappia taiwanensis]
MKVIYIRGESNPNERRTPITPQDAERLIEMGAQVKVSTSQGRCFSDDAFREVGCVVEAAESWREPGIGAGEEKPADTLTIGIKVPALDGKPMRGAHLFFAHQYTRNRILLEKPTATHMLNALRKGGGVHYDMEFLADENGARITAFSTIAGFVGTAIAIVRTCEKVRGDAGPGTLYAIPTSTAVLRESAEREIAHTRPLKIAVISPSGACGKGACALLSALGLEWTAIGHRDLGIRVSDDDLFDFDLLINCMAVDEATPAILSPPTDARPVRLAVVADIGCETNDNNPIRLRDGLSSLDAPFLLKDMGGGRVCDILAVDHLPALTPRESSEEVSRQLFPLLSNYISGSDLDIPWVRARELFERSICLLK